MLPGRIAHFFNQSGGACVSFIENKTLASETNIHNSGELIDKIRHCAYFTLSDNCFSEFVLA